jgi:hypothetical protein
MRDDVTEKKSIQWGMGKRTVVVGQDNSNCRAR